ncbi:MAG: CinA family protein [Eubacterium sp.]|nr:CinA family protein [Eubacterium sp.]
MSSRPRKNEEPVEKKIVRILKAGGLTVATAESCTGGLVAGTLVNADGISAVYKEGFITYSNEAKQKYLGVKKETLDTYGAVSRETASEMAQGAALAADADAAIVTTGIAGPDGGTEEKPVGLVYIGCWLKGKTVVKRCFFGGDRQNIRYMAVKEALDILYCQLLSDGMEFPVGDF